ncbi:copper chaperone PCu(A)C [Kribbella sindirgiensis]|uniref:copper chaperone PCu(A)C n=1 Tax=Kribbella sindirgiensis TaxID=1124744 RepID=UPI001EE08980|nr:copper chaperone PCu(A)C [Kribbella sindirgiensis]
MKTKLLLLLVPFLLGACGSNATQEAAVSTPGILVEDAWVRATTGAKDTTMTAAFLSLTNPGDTEVKLTSATSPIAAVVQLHEMAMQDGKMVMREKPGGITVPAGSHTHLSPGGDHIMLMSLKQPLKPGDEVPLTLKFSDNTTHDLKVPVKAFTEEEEHYHPTPSTK